MDNTIVEYIRRSGGHKKGMLVAGALDGRICIGYSLCHGDDQFNREVAKRIAMNRATVLTSGRGVDKVPNTVKSAVRNGFASRCQRYFKGTALPDWVVALYNGETDD